MTKSKTGFSFEQSRVISAAALFLLTLLIYWPSFRAGYIWDDDMMVEKNALVNSGWPGLRDIWTTTKYPDFVPLTATSFWLETQLGGGTAMARHTTNILLQACNVVLLWLVLRRLKIPGAWVAAAIFAAHPLCVSSVTWVAERKNTLSLFFYLGSFLLFWRTEAKTTSHFRQGTYWFSLVCYIAALLSKTSTVVLPVVFLWCAWWRDGKISRTVFRATLPFFGVAFAGGMTTLIAHTFFADKTIQYDGQLARSLAGAKAVWFYLGKALWPANLTMHYPRWEMDPRSFMAYLPGLGLAGVGVLCWRFRQSWGKAGLFGLGYFIIALAPTLGVAKMTFLKFSQVADHYQFLALPGLIALVVGGLGHWTQSAAAGQRALYFGQVLLLAAVVSALAVLSWRHQRVIGDAETLWRDNLQKNPQSWLAHYGLTSILQSRGELQAVENHYRQAIALRPNYLDALSNLGVLLGRQGRWAEALDCYQQALEHEPTVAVIHFNLGTALMAQNRYVEAVGPLTKAVELNPQQSNFRNNLASVLMKVGRRDEAFAQGREAIRLNPANDEAQANLGLMFFQSGKTAEAIEQFQNALRLNPANFQAHYRLATVWAALGQNDDALRHFSIVAQAQPENMQARAGLAEILQRQGRTMEAAAHQAAVKALRERSPTAQNAGK